jgi:predicted nucleic acid-binding protein
MRRVMIDTGAIYAFVARTDANHEAAVTFTRQVLAQESSFVLADVVFAETMTLLKARLGSAVALRAGRELRQNPAYQWMALGVDGERDAWAAFQKYDDKAWSYTDCAIFALARRLRLAEVFAFDSHFDQMPGIIRLP